MTRLTKNKLLLLYLFLSSLIFTQIKICNLIFINGYSGIFLWKISQILNSVQLNILVIIGLIGIITGLNYFIFKKKLYYRILVILYATIYFINFDVVVYSGSVLHLYKKLNIGLLNGLLIIHPWFIFVLYGFIIFIGLLIKSSVNFYKILFYRNFFKYIYLFLSSYAILLGSWWSYQELSWGGWWNWDVVELISLNFYFFTLCLIHSGLYIRFFKNIKLLKLVVVFLISIIIIRFNLLSSIHSFTNSTFSKFFFIKFLVIMGYVFSVCIILFKIFCTNTKIFFKKKYFLYFNMHIYMIVIVISLYLIIFLFFKNEFLELNIFFEFFFLYLLIYFILYFINLKKIKLFIGSFNFFLFNYLCFLTALFTSNKFKKFINSNHRQHSLIILLFIFVYFLKIYFLSISIFNEYYFFSKNFIKSYTHNTIANFNTPTTLNNYNVKLIYINIKFSTFGEFQTHYYKNLLININSFFIKIIKPNINIFMLIYKNIFILILFIFVFFFIWGRKNISAN
jgi:cytochrome c biogenesis factor